MSKICSSLVSPAFLFVVIVVSILQNVNAENVTDFFLTTIPSVLSLDRVTGSLYLGWFAFIVGRGLLGFPNHQRV